MTHLRRTKWRWMLMAGALGLTIGVAHAGTWTTDIQPWIQLGVAPAKAIGPQDSIKEIDRLLGDYRTAATLSAADVQFNRRLKRRILYGTFDIRELCRVAMGKNWEQRSVAEQDRLVALMTSLLEERAILSKEQGKSGTKSGQVYKVRYGAEQFLDKNKQIAQVVTTVDVPSRDVTVALAYRLRLVRSTWKVFDVIVDDSSLVDNYAYQFNSIIEKSGFSELIRRMEQKLTELRTP